MANPGCYPTSALLGLAPLRGEGLIETDSIIVNAVTGVSGAGKNPSSKFHFPNMNENLFAYGIGTHRHMPEMEQIASEIRSTEGVALLDGVAGRDTNRTVMTFIGSPQAVIEAAFKALALALRQAMTVDIRRKGAPSTKGVM